MNYIHTFDTNAEQEAYYASSEYREPCLSYEKETAVVRFNKANWATKPLTFEAIESGTFSFTNACSYSLDDGVTWTELAAETQTPTVGAGERISFKATSEPSFPYGSGTFSSTNSFNAMGNPYSMFAGDGFRNVSTLPDAACSVMLAGSNVVSAENLYLTASTLSMGAYMGMFANCGSLVTGPKILATTLGQSCCQSMFRSCSSLVNAPALPATTLANGCYETMFLECTSLETAPALPATTLASGCYYQMFYGCSSLVNAPALPASAAEYRCYSLMFGDCTSLEVAPVLSAATLGSYCYAAMFSGCTALVNAPALPSTTLAPYCYNSMFRGCSSLTTAPELSASTLAEECYNALFYDCSSLAYIKMLATDVSATRCLENWVYGVASNGTFVKNASMTTLTEGVSGIPAGWTVQNA